MRWIPHAVHDGNDENSIGRRLIDSDVATLDEQPRMFGYIRTGDTHLRMPCGKIEFVEETIDKTVRGRFVFRGNGSPDFPQVVLRARVRR